MNEIIQCQVFSNTIILLGLGILILLTTGITVLCLILSYKKAKKNRC